MMKDFKRYMGKKVRVIGEGSETAKSLKEYLGRHPDLESRLGREGKRTYVTTDDPEKFKKIGEKFLGHNIPKVEVVKLSGYAK